MRWLDAADEDLRAARLCLVGADAARASAAFHCHQAVEKLLKGLLVDLGIAFRKTHDLSELTASASAVQPWIDLEYADLRSLTPWSVAYRYPSVEEDVEVPPSVERLEAALERIGRFRDRLTDGWS
jgi:HEPN domain-containing protein